MAQTQRFILESYPAGGGLVTLHTYLEKNGWKDRSFYITGAPGKKVVKWFRDVLNLRTLDDVEVFPELMEG